MLTRQLELNCEASIHAGNDILKEMMDHSCQNHNHHSSVCNYIRTIKGNTHEKFLTQNNEKKEWNNNNLTCRNV